MKKPKKTTKKVDKNKLNPKQEKFCFNYVRNTFLFGNATLSYADAYGYDLETLEAKNDLFIEIWDEDKGKVRKEKNTESEYWKHYHTCGVEANRCLKNPKINDRIREHLLLMMTDDIVDGELMKIIVQNEDKKAKNTAIGEYNKLKARITNKIKLETVPVPQEEKEVADQAITQFLHGRNTKNTTK